MSAPLGIARRGERLMSRTLCLGGAVLADGTVCWANEVLYGRRFKASAPAAGLDDLPAEAAWLFWLTARTDAQGNPLHYQGLVLRRKDLAPGSSAHAGPPRADCIHLLAAAAKGALDLEDMPAGLRSALAEALKEEDPDLWQSSPSAFKERIQL